MGRVTLEVSESQVVEWVQKMSPNARRVDSDDSPLNVDGIDLGLTAGEILEFIQEGRRL